MGIIINMGLFGDLPVKRTDAYFFWPILYYNVTQMATIFFRIRAEKKLIFRGLEYKISKPLVLY